MRFPVKTSMRTCKSHVSQKRETWGTPFAPSSYELSRPVFHPLPIRVILFLCNSVVVVPHW
jgi:hypothetical protein